MMTFMELIKRLDALERRARWTEANGVREEIASRLSAAPRLAASEYDLQSGDVLVAKCGAECEYLSDGVWIYAGRVYSSPSAAANAASADHGGVGRGINGKIFWRMERRLETPWSEGEEEEELGG